MRVIHCGMRIRNQHGAEAQLRRCPAGSVDAKLCFHSGDNQLFDASVAELKLQFGIAKTAGMLFSQNDVPLGVHVEFGYQLC